MENYENLLKRAYEKVRAKDAGERFKMPQAEIAMEGNQTLIKNFSTICSVLRRDPKHLLKFLTKELAVPASSGQQMILQGKVSYSIIQQKLEEYAKEFVICKECKRPDTKLVKEDRIVSLRCEACGAKVPVKQI